MSQLNGQGIPLGTSLPWTNGPRKSFPDNGAAATPVATGAGAYGAAVKLIDDTGPIDHYLTDLEVSNPAGANLSRVNARIGLAVAGALAPAALLGSYRIGQLAGDTAAIINHSPPLRIPAHSSVWAQTADAAGGANLEIGFGYTVLS